MITKRVFVSLLAASLLGAALFAAPARGAEERFAASDHARIAYNILPPGQGRYLNTFELAEAQATGSQPAHNTDQAQMYADLIKIAPNAKAADLPNLFKDASMGLAEDQIDVEYEPREGVTIARDSGFGVPHVFGETRDDVMFGAGYASAEDRLFMMDTLRHLGRGRLSEFLGASDSNLQSDRTIYSASGYTEEELQAMIDRLPQIDRRGNQITKDINSYAEGVNAFIDEALADPTLLPGEYAALQLAPEPWVPTDTAAIASLIGSQLGVGGGGELENAAFIHALRREDYSYKKARAILRDFRFANDKEAPVTTVERFAWNTKRELDPAAVALPDDEQTTEDEGEAPSLPESVDGPFGPIPLRLPDEASNALLVGSELSETGRPLAVFGPQVGYWSPQILMEMQLQGPGISSRGVGFPGISMYTLLGRGDGYAWSATSADGDQVDILAEELCNPDGSDATIESTHYLKGDKCVEIYSRTDSWFAKPSAGGTPEEPGADRVLVEMTTERTDDGIVQARGTVDKKPVVFVQKRSTFMREVDSASTYVDIMNPDKINNAVDFRRAFGRFGFTFNWFYVDDRDIAYQLGGYHPIRSKAVDLDLPFWGNKAAWDWRGMLPFRRTPNARNPERGYITSWNNKQAPGFRSADSNFNYGPVHREMPLSDGIKAATKDDGVMSITDLVNVMGDAATVDLRGYAVLPYMLEAIGKPADDRLKDAAKLLKKWHESGAHRRDVDGDGSYDDSAAVALMDEWWERALTATFSPVLGAAYDDLPAGHDNAPGPEGSAYIGGLYGHMQKDLRTILGYNVRSPFSRTYCGKGNLQACRKALTESLDEAIKALEEEFAPSPASWDADEEGDMIQFSPVGVQGQDPIPWQNRPTFQQVLEFNRYMD